MTRFVACLLVLALTSLATPDVAAAPKKKEPAFDVVEADLASLQEAMAKGRATSRSLVEAYLARIKAIDQGGP